MMQVPLMADMKQRGTSLFCPKCKSIFVLNRATGQRECKRPDCGHSELNNGPQAFISERKNKQIIRSGGSNFELKDKVCKRYCRCAKCFATKDDPDSISFWSY